MVSNEKIISNPSNGYMMLFIIFLLFIGSIAGFIMLRSPWMLLVLVLSIFLAAGLILVNPNESRVLLLFGEYIGSVKKNGLFWVNPLYTKKKKIGRASCRERE